MEKISEAILSKVKAEAQDIVKEAEVKAKEELEKAKRQQEARFEDGRRKVLEEAEEEAARMLAQAAIKARQELTGVKAEIVARVTDKAKSSLSRISGDESWLLGLIKEAVGGIGSDKARIYVSSKDVSRTRKLLERDEELASRIMEVREFDCMGGVIAENIEGGLRIDNTYETRLEMLLPRLLPEISKELFASK